MKSDEQVDHDEQTDVIRTLYHLRATESPSARLDSEILTLAASYVLRENPQVDPKSHDVAAANTINKAPFWQRFRWPISTAASVFLVVGLFVLSPNLRQSAPESESRLYKMSEPTIAPMSKEQAIGNDSKVILDSEATLLSEPAYVESRIQLEASASMALTPISLDSPEQIDATLTEMERLIGSQQYQAAKPLAQALEQFFTADKQQIYSEYYERFNTLNHAFINE